MVIYVNVASSCYVDATFSLPILWKLVFDSSPSNISGETSSASRLLLGRVKPVWVGAQGDRGGLGVDRERTHVD